MPSFKIIPLLVMVAFLAFSVRLVEVASGVGAMTGAAYAVEKSDKKPPVMAKDLSKMDMEEELDSEEGAADKDEEDGSLTDEDIQIGFHTDEPIDWLDANDSDLEYSAVRMELFKDMSNRRKELEAIERQLITREALLRAAEKELDQKYQELTQLRGEIENLLQEQSEEETARLNSLVRIYEGMKPKEAARIFNTLDLDILVAVMGEMSERKSSPVLANMNPERARTVTIMLAEQKKLPELPKVN